MDMTICDLQRRYRLDYVHAVLLHNDLATRQAELELVQQALSVAAHAVNGWASVARRTIEHDEIDRLHRAIRDIRFCLDIAKAVSP